MLPVTRTQHSGRVFKMSSVGGITTGQGSGIYGGTEYAVGGHLRGHAPRTRAAGEPRHHRRARVLRTNVLDGSSLQTAATMIDDCAETAGRTRVRSAATNGRQQGGPAEAARVIADVEARSAGVSTPSP